MVELSIVPVQEEAEPPGPLVFMKKEKMLNHSMLSIFTNYPVSLNVSNLPQ